jgi:hypothetical protein
MFTQSATVNIDRQQLLIKADELEKQINQLTAMRDGLRHAAVCPEPSHLECPKFNKLLLSANRRIRKQNKR